MRRSHKKPILRNSCASKRRYDSKHEAEATAEDQMNLDPDLKLRVYQCPYCAGWHLTKVKML